MDIEIDNETQLATNAAPRLTKRIVTVRLPKNEYPGFTFEAWVNAPAKHWQKILNPWVREGDLADELEPLTVDTASEAEVAAAQAIVVARHETELLRAFQMLVVSHNGWLNFDGEPFPPPNQKSFFDEIPSELLACMLVALQDAEKKLPGSLRQKKRR